MSMRKHSHPHRGAPLKCSQTRLKLARRLRLFAWKLDWSSERWPQRPPSPRRRDGRRYPVFRVRRCLSQRDSEREINVSTSLEHRRNDDFRSVAATLSIMLAGSVRFHFRHRPFYDALFRLHVTLNRITQEPTATFSRFELRSEGMNSMRANGIYI